MKACSGPLMASIRVIVCVLGWLATLLAHGMVGEKRQRLAIVQKSPTVSLSNIQHILKDLGSVDDPEEKDIRINDELNEHLAIDTTCGPLLQHVDLQTKTDKPYKWLVCNPLRPASVSQRTLQGLCATAERFACSIHCLLHG